MAGCGYLVRKRIVKCVYFTPFLVDFYYFQWSSRHAVCSMKIFIKQNSDKILNAIRVVCY